MCRLIIPVAVLLAATPLAAQDIDARTMAMIYDTVNGPASPGVDAASIASARQALESAKLLTPTRVAIPEPDFVEAYGKALLLGPRAREFLPELAAVRNVAIRRDREATAAAIVALLKKAGRPRPDSKALDKIVDDVIGAGAQEGPEETARRRVEKPGRTIEVTDAKRAGLFTVEVTETPPGGTPKRTVITAEKNLTPNAQGTGFEQHAVPIAACTISAADAAQRRLALNGKWTDQSGKHWEISGSGETITLAESSAGKPPISYSGTYRLGRVQATHQVTAPSDIENSLPDWVRAGLVGRTSFVVRLDDCDPAHLRGTWESRHVTYNPTFSTIERIHDPYDLRLELSRGTDLKMARGGRLPEEGP